MRTTLNYTRGVLAVVGVAAVMATGLLATAGPASAARSSICNPGCEAKAALRLPEKHPRREILIVHDRKQDGHSGVGEVEIFDPALNQWLGLGDRVYFNSRGFGGRPKKVRLNVGEGESIRYRACVGDRDAGDTGNGEFFDCGAWRQVQT